MNACIEEQAKRSLLISNKIINLLATINELYLNNLFLSKMRYEVCMLMLSALILSSEAALEVFAYYKLKPSHWWNFLTTSINYLTAFFCIGIIYARSSCINAAPYYDAESIP